MISISKYAPLCFFPVQELTKKDRYPNDISPDTAVPAWAYLDVVTTDKFEAVSASQGVDLPESTIGNNPMSTSPPLTSSSNNKSLNTAAIIGITVGSTVVLVLIGVLSWLHKKGKLQVPLSVFADMRLTPRAARHPNILLPNSPNPDERGPLPSLAAFRLGNNNATPFSPPLRSNTPLRVMTPMSVQSPLSTNNDSSRTTQGDHGMNYYNLSSELGTSDALENTGSMSSVACVGS
jgi:hypothetical protein